MLCSVKHSTMLLVQAMLIYRLFCINKRSRSLIVVNMCFYLFFLQNYLQEYLKIFGLKTRKEAILILSALTRLPCLFAPENNVLFSNDFYFCQPQKIKIYTVTFSVFKKINLLKGKQKWKIARILSASLNKKTSSCGSHHARRSGFQTK